MVVIIRSNEVNPDPRVQKYVDYLESKSIDHIILGWNRIGIAANKNNYIYFERRAKYGMRFKNILNKLLWFKFIIRYLIFNKKNYEIVHACDFDTALPVYIASIITRKRYIFDVFDWMSDNGKKGLFNKILRTLENYVAKKASNVIVCEEERKSQLNIDKSEVLVMPNIPGNNYVEDIDIVKDINKQRDKYRLVVSYVGVFDANRGIEDILELAKQQKDVFFNFAGFGRYDEVINKCASQEDNIKYWGKVEYNKGLNIMKQSDLIMAMYYLTNPVHKYAAPNKFYEGLMLGVPIITTKGTLVGNKSVKYDTGFVIDQGLEPLRELLKSTELKEELLKKAHSSHIVWEKKYKDDIENFMKKTYLKVIND